MKFNGTMRYIDDLLTLNNSSFASKIPDTVEPPKRDQLGSGHYCPCSEVGLS